MENREANQAAFDKVVRHLLRQNAKSYKPHDASGNASFECAYRGMGGLQCAVGCLIPDHEYDSRMDSEATGITRLMSRFDPPSLRGLDANLLASLQTLHDSRPPPSWRSDLEELAERRGLTMPDLEPSP